VGSLSVFNYKKVGVPSLDIGFKSLGTIIPYTSLLSNYYLAKVLKGRCLL
jgi:hypothetical protein